MFKVTPAPAPRLRLSSCWCWSTLNSDVSQVKSFQLAPTSPISCPQPRSVWDHPRPPWCWPAGYEVQWLQSFLVSDLTFNQRSQRSTIQALHGVLMRGCLQYRVTPSPRRYRSWPVAPWCRGRCWSPTWRTSTSSWLKFTGEGRPAWMWVLTSLSWPGLCL